MSVRRKQEIAALITEQRELRRRMDEADSFDVRRAYDRVQREINELNRTPQKTETARVLSAPLRLSPSQEPGRWGRRTSVAVLWGEIGFGLALVIVIPLILWRRRRRALELG